MTDAPTYDELLAKFNEQSQMISELKEKYEASENKINSLNKDLETSRALNTKLMFEDTTVRVPNSEPVAVEPEPETMEQFIDSFVDKAIDIVNARNRKEIYAHDN